MQFFRFRYDRQHHGHDPARLAYHRGSGILHCPWERKWLETKDEVCLLWRRQTKQRQHQMIIIIIFFGKPRSR